MNSRHSRPPAQPQQPSRPRIDPIYRGPQAMSTAAQAMGPGAAAVHHAPNAALLIDFDNVTMGIRSDLQSELKNLLSSDIVKGRVSVQRAYADWRRYPQYIVPLSESSIDLIFAPAYGSSKKNATDIRLAIDALELVFTRPEIGTFILLSGDSDFSSLVIKLKEYGKYVIGVGIRESSSDLLVQNCNEYYSYNALAGLIRTSDEEVVKWDPWELVVEAIGRMRRNGDVMRSDRLKQVMQEIDSSFDEKDLGMAKFSRFVNEAASRGLLRVTRLENGQLEVAPGDGAEGSAGVGAAVPGGGPAASRGDRGGRFDAGTAVAPAADEGEDTEAGPERGERGEFREAADEEGRRRRRGRGRGRDRDRDRGDRGDRGDREGREPREMRPPTEANASPHAPTSHQPAFVPSAAPAQRGRAPAIGVGGERLTRQEAFDLVRRATEALVSGDETTSASRVRERAFELLGRDSESLSERMFERILRDAHDAERIDLRRRGNDWEVALPSTAAPVAEQLGTAGGTPSGGGAATPARPAPTAVPGAAPGAAPAAPPIAPRGLGPRGVGGRPGLRGGPGRPGTPPPDLFAVGVVDFSSGTEPASVNTPETRTPVAHSVEAPSLAGASAGGGATADEPAEAATSAAGPVEMAEAEAARAGGAAGGEGRRGRGGRGRGASKKAAAAAPAEEPAAEAPAGRRRGGRGSGRKTAAARDTIAATPAAAVSAADEPAAPPADEVAPSGRAAPRRSAGGRAATKSRRGGSSRKSSGGRRGGGGEG